MVDVPRGIAAETAKGAIKLTRGRRHCMTRQMRKKCRLFVEDGEFAVWTLESGEMMEINDAMQVFFFCFAFRYLCLTERLREQCCGGFAVNAIIWW